MTLSAGLCGSVSAALPAPADAGALYQQADAALYRAKQEGRNRVVAHSASAPGIADPATRESS